MNAQELNRLKQKFLADYNPRMEHETALTSGLKAAAQHNALYAPGASRQEVRATWKTLLEELGLRYKKQVTREVYEDDIERLKREMNSRFADHFRPTGTGVLEPGFRISHAQKSLAVYLKHLWCMGGIAMPPECPIDRFVLRHADWTGSRVPRWTAVNSIQDHRAMIGRLDRVAAGEPLAEWELALFAQ